MAGDTQSGRPGAAPAEPPAGTLDQAARAAGGTGTLAAALREAALIDQAVYAAIARVPTPTLDRTLQRISRAADYSRLWLGISAALALAGGPAGRRAARSGLVATAVTATIVNAALKPLGRRRRPDRAAEGVPEVRHVRMPITRSFPSGHAASAFAFATATGHALPAAAVPLRVLAALVAYTRIHTGVHYPGDVAAGALVGAATAGTIAGLQDASRRRALTGGS